MMKKEIQNHPACTGLRKNLTNNWGVVKNQTQLQTPLRNASVERLLLCLTRLIAQTSLNKNDHNQLKAVISELNRRLPPVPEPVILIPFEVIQERARELSKDILLEDLTFWW